MTPKISVILTTYNRYKKLKRAVKSVLSQTFKEWELIIVDDCSNKDAKQIQNYCKKIANKDSRISYVRRSSNFGQHTRPKNEGTKLAHSSYIAYLDDDNEYRRDHLQVLWKYMESFDVDVVYGDRWLIDETGSGKNTLGIAAEFNYGLLSQQNFIDTSDVLIKKEAIEKIGGWDESLPKFADWNLWIRMAKNGASFKHIPIIITDYYVHRGCNQFKHDSGIDPQTGRAAPTFQPDGCKIWPDTTSYGVKPKTKVAIFTLTMDRLDYTKKMYSSMMKTAGYEFDWFVVDNGSKDKTVEFLQGKAFRLATNSKNFGISKASNQALDRIKEDGPYDVIIKIDNDCQFLTNDWLKEIVDLLERNKMLIVSPRVEGLRDNPGGVPRTRYFYIGHHFLGMAPHIGGICCAADAKIYENFRWEEEDFLHGEQDYVFSKYVTGQQKILAYMENLIVEHIDTTAGQLKTYPKYEQAKTKLKTKKYKHS